MPQNVLIVEDEQSAVRVLSAMCAELGLSVRHARTQKEAVDEAAKAAGAGTPFSAVILDLVLAEGDGFQVAQQMRAQPWGQNLPILVVSGIYKQLANDFQIKVRPAAFFPKPFEPKAMREALTKVTGATGGAKAIEGSVQQKPASALFVELLRQKQTGVLTLQQGDTKRVVTYQQGMIRFAQSNVRGEAVGAAQVTSGLIKQTSFDRAVALARQQGVPLHEALASARVMTPEQLKVALKQSVLDVCIAALAWTDGTYRFEPKPVEGVTGMPDIRTSPVAVVLEGAKRLGNPPAARAWLEQRSQERLNRSPELEREMFSLRTYWPAEGVTPLTTSGRTVVEVLARVKEAELPLLHALAQSTLLTLSGGPASQPKPHPAAPEGAGDEDKGKVFTAQESATRRMLFGERDHLKDATHYEVLGVDNAASPEDLKKAYIAAAKRFHSDTFAGMELGSARRVAEELFAKVGEANSVLSDKDKRADYDVYLDRKAKGLPTDVAAILRAEGLFQKGEVQFKQGKWEDAEATFREAIALNHTEAEFHAYLGMAIFKRTGKADLGLQHVEKALEMEPRLRSGVLFAAQLLEAQGEAERAKTLLRKALEKDPEFSDAKDTLRRMKNKPAAEQKGGFFSRLLSKK